MTADAPSTYSKKSLFLYAAYISTCLEDRAWSFCVSLCMELMGGMRIVSIEQLFEGLLQMFASGHLGKVFDGLSRKRAIMTVVPFNNLSICAAAILLITCLSVNIGSTVYIVCLIFAMIMCALNRLFLNAEKLITSRDWIIVLGDSSTLSNYNAVFTILDQGANVVAPLITGALASLLGLRTTVAIFGAASLISMTSKSIFLRLIYTSTPALHTKKADKQQDPQLTTDEVERSSQMAIIESNVLKTYWRQSSFSVAFGMALMFMTVMGFDGLAVGYGSSVGLPEFMLGIFRAYGSVTGILGAVSYAFFEKRYSVATAGILGLVSQQVFIIMAVISIWLPGSPMNLSGYFGNFTIGEWWNDLTHSFDGSNSTNIEPHVDWHNFTSNGISLVSIFVFLIGIATARYGLWCLDLSMTHIMQVTIPETERYTVFGVHNSLCQAFSVLKDIMVIILPLPTTFGICIIISYLFVLAGHMFFVYYLVQTNTLKTVGKRLSRTDTPEKESRKEDRAWSFCVSLCMVFMGGMRVVSIEQLFEGVLQMSLSGYLGRIFDGLTRKRAIMTVVPLNNFSICIAAGLLITCLSVNQNSPAFVICLITAMIMCAINRLFLNAEKFITGRDWVLVLGDEKTLSNLNATLTTLDQFTNVIAPLLTGALVSWFNLRTTVAIFGIGSLVSMSSKTFFLRSIYTNNKLLHEKKVKEVDEIVILEPVKTSVIGTYWKQSSFSAAFGMSLIFMTVMGFDGLAVGYGSSVGLPEFLLGAFRSYGSFMGILGAMSYAFFEKRFSVVTSGILGLIVQQVFAILAVVSVWLPGSPKNLHGYFSSFTISGWWNDLVHSFNGNNATNAPVDDINWHKFTSNGVSMDSIFVFLIAIATARYGLWCLDLAITHIMQVTIPENERNTVFGVHNALCQSFSVLKDLMVILIPLPSTFAICIWISYLFVLSGHLFYCYYALKSRNSPASVKKSTST